MGTALLTDRYELTMIDAAMGSGMHDRECVFEVFTRRLPEGRRYGMVAGTGRLLDAIESFRFGDDELAFLRDNAVVRPDAIDWLADFRFRGQVWGYREGETFFPGSPLLVVEGSFAEAVLLETIVLSVLNYDSAVASAAADTSASRLRRAMSWLVYLAAITSPCSVMRKVPSTAPGGWASTAS